MTERGNETYRYMLARDERREMYINIVVIVLSMVVVFVTLFWFIPHAVELIRIYVRGSSCI